MLRWRKLWRDEWTRQLITVLAVGLASVLVTQLAGWAAQARGAPGGLVGIPFGHAVVLGALMLSATLGLPRLCCGNKTALGVLMGAGVWMVAMGATWAWTVALERVGLEVRQQEMVARLAHAGRAEFAYIAFVVGCWAPIVEEIFFRGWLLSVLRQKLPAMAAMLWVAIVFALLHGDVVVMPGLLVAGVGFGLAALWWGMSAAVAAHVVFNLVTIMAARGGWLSL